MANYFSSSIIFLYRFTVPSFSFTCLVYSTRTTVISFFYFSVKAFSSSIYFSLLLICFSRLLISSSCSLNRVLIFSISSLLNSSSEDSELDDDEDSGFFSSLFDLESGYYYFSAGFWSLPSDSGSLAYSFAVLDSSAFSLYFPSLSSYFFLSCSVYHVLFLPKNERYGMVYSYVGWEYINPLYYFNTVICAGVKLWYPRLILEVKYLEPTPTTPLLVC